MSEKVYTIEEIRTILQDILKDKPVYQVILFGSYAKKEATKQSDIDIVIDTRAELDGFEKYEILENSLIDKEIKETGVIVYEK